MTIRIQMLGPLSVAVGCRELGPTQFSGRKPKQLLEILLVRRGQPVVKDQLADLLWGEDAPANPVASLEHYVSLLRRRLDQGGPGRSIVRTVPDGYQYDGADVELDVDVVDAVYARSAAGRVGRTELERACRLLTGDFLADEPYAPWAFDERARYERRGIELLTAASLAALVDGAPHRAVELASAAVAHDPFAEPAYRVLMLAHYDLGRQGDSALAFDACRRALTTELGVDPLAETLALREAILTHHSPAELRASLASHRVRDAVGVG